jgi:hypothetical protein
VVRKEGKLVSRAWFRLATPVALSTLSPVSSECRGFRSNKVGKNTGHKPPKDVWQSTCRMGEYIYLEEIEHTR